MTLREFRSQRLNIFARVVIWIPIWLLITNLLAELGGVFMMQPYTAPLETARVYTAWRDYPNAEIFLVGSSYAHRAFVPEAINQQLSAELGSKWRSYNLGVEGLRCRGAYSLLKGLLARTNPRVVVYGMIPSECSTRKGRRERMRYLRTLASPIDAMRLSWEGQIASLAEARESLAAMFRPSMLPVQWTVQLTFGAATRIGVPPTQFMQQLEKARRKGGWMSVRFESGRMGNGPIGRYVPSRIDWKTLQRMGELCSSHGVVLVLAVHPYLNAQRDIGGYSRFVHDFPSYCQMEGIHVFDLSQKPFRPEVGDFDRDGTHLMAWGAERLSRRFAAHALSGLLRDGTPVSADRVSSGAVR
jgi:hypothetical protein